jgi:hypothetical protein
MLLWAIFHLRSIPVPNFVPDFSDPKFGEFGRRDWYNNLLFFSSTGLPTVPMKYKSEFVYSHFLLREQIDDRIFSPQRKGEPHPHQE